MKLAVICAGGPVEELANLDSWRKLENVVFIGADKGSLYLLQNGIIPDAAVGDFDSMSADEFEELSNRVNLINVAPAEKNETDTDLALSLAVNYSPQQVIVTGVTGGRLDHFMAVLNSVYRFQMDNPHIKFFIRNKWNEMSLLSPGYTTLENQPEYPFVSFFAFQGQVEQLTLAGMKYNVDKETIEMGNSRFTSNEVLDEQGSIFFEAGICLLIRSSDQ